MQKFKALFILQMVRIDYYRKLFSPKIHRFHYSNVCKTWIRINSIFEKKILL